MVRDIFKGDQLSFNGATAMKPWKSENPLPPVRRRPCFNGATAMKPWKSYRRPLVARLPHQLQWGHGDEAVEEQRANASRQQNVYASMGPRR